MDSLPPTPLIYSPILRFTRLGILGRLVALAMAGAALAVLITAARLTPNPDGLGTHRELGMDECEFLHRTGLPCIACGMTTSFAWFVRGNVAASFYVQPMGAVLAILTAAVVWVGLYVALTGRPSYRMLFMLPMEKIVIPLLGFSLLAWGWKIFIHLHGIDGWR